jgi:hypothetical protein
VSGRSLTKKAKYKLNLVSKKIDIESGGWNKSDLYCSKNLFSQKINLDFNIGNLILVPRIDSHLYKIYINIINKLKGKHWVARVILRNDNTVSNSARFDELQGKTSSQSDKGLIWRKLPDKPYEYRYIE